MNKEETKQTSNNSIDEYLEIINDLSLIEQYPNMKPFLTIVTQKREASLSELLA